ncbi:gamma-glutamylcyclotransferase [Ideonella sp. 4Y11]|uniref:glutathione-specific gamma-glutamylcyclotransferase n=1 Tax=Ideonella aquatica TaxID=2824119 RepID=A0A941BMX9_9BURK|nr:gamma-glutamylcyclotransferase [Ideonella aquatica]MBQ0961349.1 gamma-glutamylcyclotransferase [Ideonella aquatica]
MHPALPDSRDPAPLLARTLHEWGGQGPLWLFAYGSLIWKPDFDAVEQHPAQVMGWHRCLRMRSRINRGTPEQPGLVLALVRGGSCRGLALRLPDESAEATLRQLWLREMPTGTYTPRWLRCHTPQGPLRALAFTLDRHSPAHVGALADQELLHILRHAQGRYGRTLDYLVQTEEALRRCGITDRHLASQVRLARQHGLL